MMSRTYFINILLILSVSDQNYSMICQSNVYLEVLSLFLKGDEKSLIEYYWLTHLMIIVYT